MRFELPRSRASRIRHAAATAAVATAAVLAFGAGPAAAALTTSLADVKINEVESNNDSVHGDWIELYNTGAGGNEVDLSGVILSDSENDHQFVIASGTHLDVHDWIAFEVEDDFGLGAVDSARLFDAGANLAVDDPADIYSWTSHAATTYGASPDGSGNFVTTTASTFDAANNFGAPIIRSIAGVKINEVESNNDSANGDWVELYNTNTTGTINIDGAIITDSDPAHQFVVPSTTPDLAAGGYAAFRLDNPAVAGNFGLGASDSAKLYAPGDVTLATVVDEYSWTNHATITWGRDVAGVGTFVQTSVSTFGAANQFSAAPIDNLTGVVINEAESHGDDTNGDWVELKNTSGSTVTLDGAILSDSDNGHVRRFPNPTSGADTTLAAGALMAVRTDDPALIGNAEFGLGDSDSIRLFKSNTVDLNTTPVTGQSWATHAVRTYGLNGSGVWGPTKAGTFGTANDFSSTITANISDVVLNEVVTTDDTVHGDWVELLNTSSTTTINIGGALIADNGTPAYTIPANTMLAPGAVYVHQTEPDFGLGKPDAVRFFRAGTTVTATAIPLDHHDWEQHPIANLAVNPFASYARQSGGMGDWITDTTPSYNATN